MRRRSAWLFLAVALTIWIPHAVEAQEEFPSELKAVNDVRLEGRRRVSAKEIRSVLKTRRPSFFPWRERPVVRLDFLNADVQAIETVYRHHGFLDARAEYRLTSTREPGEVVVTFVIYEGERSRVTTVDLIGVQAVPEDQVRRKLHARPERPFSPAFLVIDTTVISDVYKEHGYLPHVVGTATRESLSVRVRYEVNEGPRYRNGAVYLSSVSGPPVKERLVRRELLLKPGDAFRASRVQRSVERLYETGLFSQVQISPLVDSTNTLVEYDLRLRQRKPRWIDAGVGSGTEERFRFTGEWGHRNVVGQGLQGAVAAKLALDGRARFLLSGAQASLLEPWLLRSRTRGLATVYHEDRRDRADPRWVLEVGQNGVSFELRRDLGRWARIALIQDNTFVSQDISFLGALTPDVQDSLTLAVRPKYTTHRLELGLNRDTRDDPLNPSAGSAQHLSGEVAKGTSSFSKLQFSSSWYLPVRTRWVLATRVQAGAIDPFGPQVQLSPGTEALDPAVARVPLLDRFRIGGVNSLRGYDENTVPISGGLAMILANLELRVPIVGPFGLEFFVDAGNVWSRSEYIKGRNFIPRATEERMDPSDVRYLFGAGARVQLPFGPLRIDFTWSPRPDDRGDWKVAEPQFAIGPTF